MDPIKKLVDEHRNILAVLESFDHFAAMTVSSDRYDLEKLGRYVKFIREYADKYHHAKEENILFVTMEEHGFSRQAGPIAVMLYEHDEGRKYVKFLLEASQEPQDLSEDERRAVANAIRAYTELLRSHIYKEDNILYPMANQNLPKEAYQMMTEKFNVIEREYEASGAAAGLEALHRELTGVA